jgi:hypothetical protein
LVGTAAGKLRFPELFFVLRERHDAVLRVAIMVGRYRQHYYQAFGECGKSDRQNDRQKY